MGALAVTPVAAGARLQVDLDAVAANTRLFAARTPGALMAVVKADGFGHGAVAVARTALAHGASWLGVTSLGEALALRADGLHAPVLSWLNPVEADFTTAIGGGVDLAVPSLAHLDAIARAGIGARVHLHLDTGMARDGAAPADWASLCRAARRAEAAGLVRVVGVMGHLGCADVPDDPANAAGRTTFAWGVATARAAGLRPPLRHLAATAATLTDPASLHTMSRVGAGLVGIDPSGTTALRPALTLTAPVVSVRRVPSGTSVGYGHAWSALRPTTLALLPLGYADGLPRATSGRAQVWLRGRRRPVVGRVSMDQVVVDVGEEAVLPGEVATVFGPGRDGEPTVAEWAAWADTIEHEIVTGIGARVALVVIRVAVIGGGASCEHDVSLASAASVAAALDVTAYDVVRLTIGRDGTWLDGGGRPVGLTGAACLLRRCDVVLPVVHGPRGEDGTLAALCELAGLPYVGSGVRAGALAMDKWATKLVANAVGVATAPGVLISRPVHAWTHPVVVKPVAAGSSHGVSLVRRASEMDAALVAAFALDERVLVEDVVAGREIDVAVIGRPDGTRLVSPALEIVVDGVFGHDDKYGGAADLRVPAAIDDAEAKALEDAAVAMYDALGCAGVARVDFFLTDGGPVLNEVNTVPGFTEQSQVPRMFAAAGLSYPALLDLLVRDALG